MAVIRDKDVDENHNEIKAKEEKVAALHALSGFPSASSTTLSDQELHELLYDDMLQEYKKLS